MTRPEPNDDQLFDRLADGELTAAERERLLASLDDREDGWRRCALAFLEAQLWRSEMRQLVAKPTTRQAVVLPSPLQGAFGSRASHLLTLAAGVLLALFAVWLVRSPDTSVGTLHQMADTTIEKHVTPEDIARDLGPEDVVTLLVRDVDGVARRLRVPLMESAGLDDRLGTMATSLPPGFREDLEQCGFDLQSRRRYAPLYFEQNEQLVPMMVPVDDASIVPVSLPVY